MIKIDERRYKADEGKTFVHKTTYVRMGNGIYLGDSDSIKNYKEEQMTDEEIAQIEEEKEKQKIDRKQIRKGA